MSDLINDIQTISKTKLLEEKLSKALAQSDSTVNSSVTQSPVPEERSVGVADGTTSSGSTTTNSSGILIVGGNANAAATANAGVLALGYVPAAQDPNGTPTNGGSNVSLANLSGGLSAAQEAQQQVNSANGILKEHFTGNAATQSAIKTYNNSDMTNNTADSAVGGVNAYNVATNGANDSILSGIQQSSVYQASSLADQQAATYNYIADNYNSFGYVTADQIQKNTYPPNYNPYEDPLSGVIGFDPLGKISTATAALLAMEVQIGVTEKFPDPTKGDTIFGSQNTTWIDPTTLPPYDDFQLGKTWSTSNPEPANGATPSQCMDNAIASVHLINPGGQFTYAYWDVTTLAPVLIGGIPNGNYQATWYAKQKGASINPGSVTTIFGSSCTPPSTNCPIVAPTYTALPKTGVSVLQLTNGKVGYNPYDSELPDFYKQSSNSVTLACGDGVHVVNSNFLTIQDGINGGKLITVKDASGTFQWANYYDSTGLLKYVNVNAFQATLLRP